MAILVPANGMVLRNTGDGSGSTFGRAASVTGIPMVFQFYTLLTNLDTPADIVTDFVVPFDCTVISWQMVTRVVATSGGTADADIDLQIGATPITGAKKEGLTQADFAAVGQVKAGGTITAANTIAAGGTFSVVCTESAVNFTAGAIDIYVYVVATDLTGKMRTAGLLA